MRHNMKTIVLIFFCLGCSLANADELTDALGLGQAKLANGYYREAEQHFAFAENLAKQKNDDYDVTLVKALQGYMALQRQQYEQAEKVLVVALNQAKKQSWQDLIVRIDLYLAQLYQHTQDINRAKFYLQHATNQAEQVKDKALLVSAWYQTAQTLIAEPNIAQAKQALQQANQLMQTLPINAASSQLWLNIGYQTAQLYTVAPEEAFLADAFHALNQALTLAQQQKQPRIESSALKHLASLYTQQQKYDEAIALLLEGIHHAQQDDASDLLVDLEWHIGQLYQLKHNHKEAIAAYRLAVQHIERIRIDIPVSYQQGRSSFRDTFAPIYLALSDLLLQQSGDVQGSQQQALLIEARDYIERMKKSELEDYFQSRCEISASPLNLQKTDVHAAAVYPILLPNRLEIIVATANGLQRFTSPVPARQLEQYARLYAEQLRNYSAFSKSKTYSKFLYQALIAPINASLKQQHIETLVYIPDGVLRLVPLAALHNGEQFVIEQYAVATSIGMTFVDSQEEQHQNHLLLAGMSQAGDVVRELPNALLEYLILKTIKNDNEKRSLERNLASKNDIQKTQLLQKLLTYPDVIKKIQNTLALPGVETEIKQLAAQNQVDYLLNESFSAENFTEVLTQQPHDVLHIASHGFFGSTADESFIMSHNKILNLNQLEALLSSDYFKRHPIDLLTLSACQTAEGDDRSPLGIGGVAIKTKVHSALGSLWSVSDNATAQLMATFYQSLKQPNQSKAKALQQAMLKLLEQKDFKNPSYWSPFILIGNWT